MLLVGKLHPLLVHFPIGLVLASAAGSELVTIWTRRQSWRALAVANVRAGALFGAAALVALAGHLGAALVWGTDVLKP